MQYAINVIAAFVRNVHLKRAVHAVQPRPHLNFWRVIYGNFLDMAVIEWCKLFGSDHLDHQPVHWKNVVPQAEQDTFRQQLLVELGMSLPEWRAYWNHLKDYRDNHAAHFNETFLAPQNNPTYPDFDIALRAAFFYYRWILDHMDTDARRRYPADIEEYCARFSELAETVAQSALQATSDIEESVN